MRLWINRLKERGKSIPGGGKSICKGPVVRPLRVSRMMQVFFAAILMSQWEWEDEEGRFLLCSLTLVLAPHCFSGPSWLLGHQVQSRASVEFFSKPGSSSSQHSVTLPRQKEVFWSPCLPGAPPPHRYPCSGCPCGFSSQQLLSQALSPASQFSFLRLYPRPCPAAVPSLCPEEGLHFASPGPHTVLLGWLHTAISPSIPPPLRDTIPAFPQFGQSFNNQIASFFFCL